MTAQADHPGKVRAVVFTDLDGTLLNSDDYSWRNAEPALERLEELGIPVILNSSKTRPEMLALRESLGNRYPFVVENGAAIFSAKAYFNAFGSLSSANEGEAEGGLALDMELLGPPRQDVLRILAEIRSRRGFRFQGFADMTLDDVIRHTDLPAEEAELARDRMGTEPLLWRDEKHPPEELARELEAHGLKLVSGGRFFHAMGQTDKGVATKKLISRFAAQTRDDKGSDALSVALGDSPNDFPMLHAVDRPVLIPRLDGKVVDPGPLPDLYRATQPGAAGWLQAINFLLTSI